MEERQRTLVASVSGSEGRNIRSENRIDKTQSNRNRTHIDFEEICSHDIKHEDLINWQE